MYCDRRAFVRSAMYCGALAIAPLPLWFPEPLRGWQSPGAAATPPPGSSASQGWTALTPLRERFLRGEDRFECERLNRALQPSLGGLRQALLASERSEQDQDLFADRAKLALVPARRHERRRGPAFRIIRYDRRSLTEQGAAFEAITNGADALAEFRRWLHAEAGPMRDAYLHVIGIAGQRTPDEGLSTTVEFELNGEAADGLRWQANGDWEIAWTRAAGSADVSSRPKFRIAQWTCRTMDVVIGPARSFTDVTAAAFGNDARFTKHLARDTNYWRTVLDSASGIDIFGNCGISVGDIDGDGQDEIYLCQPQGLPNRLFRQYRPGVFEDISQFAGVDLLDATSTALFADFSNQGRQDLLLITQARPMLFANAGGGRFEYRPQAFPSSSSSAALTGAAIADYDRDGYLDVYVCSYSYFQGQGLDAVPLPFFDARNGPPNRLYRNRGDGTFADVTEAAGLNAGNNRYSFACAWHDVDSDGWPDLCVVNDFGRNDLYLNRRNGSFEYIAGGLAGYGSGMSASFADVDGDDAAELYVGNMWMPPGRRVNADPEFRRLFNASELDKVTEFADGNRLYGHRDTPAREGTALFDPAPNADGADRGGWAWCCGAFDIENTGQLDLYSVNGFMSAPAPETQGAGGRPEVNRNPALTESHDEAAGQGRQLDSFLWEEVIASSPHDAQPSAAYRAAWATIFDLAHRDYSFAGDQRNAFFLNEGDGQFADASAVAGLDFTFDGRAFAMFDFDNDGDTDLVLHHRTGPQLQLLRNDIADRHRALAIALIGEGFNRDAVGTRVSVVHEGRRQTRWVAAGSGFLAQHSKVLTFGLGESDSASTIEVHWPDGSESRFENLAAGWRYTLHPRRGIVSRMALERKETASAAPAAPIEISAPPTRFSANLTEPLLVPAESGDYAMLEPPAGAVRWVVWFAIAADAQRIAAALPQASRLARWPDREVVGGGNRGSDAPAGAVEAPPRLRQWCEIIVPHLFDRRIPLKPPFGLFLEKLEHGHHVSKVYFGEPNSDELERDLREGIPKGAAALPFSGRVFDCRFTREPQSLGAPLALAGLYREALPFVAQAASDSPNDPEAAFNLALTNQRLGNTVRALQGVERALSLRPQFPEAENLLGVILVQRNQAMEARRHFETATRLAPEFPEAWSNLGYVQLRARDFAGARVSIERALALAPSFTEALNNYGILCASEGDVAAARDAFDRVLTLDPGNEEAQNNIAVLLASQGRSEEAATLLRSILKANPEARETLINLARLDLSAGRRADARALLSEWLQRHPDDTGAKSLLVKAKG
jgi:Flp pilus assembly protein TadD